MDPAVRLLSTRTPLLPLIPAVPLLVLVALPAALAVPFLLALTEPGALIHAFAVPGYGKSLVHYTDFGHARDGDGDTLGACSLSQHNRAFRPLVAPRHAATAGDTACGYGRGAGVSCCAVRVVSPSDFTLGDWP
jgi:hypothetical protein